MKCLALLLVSLLLLSLLVPIASAEDLVDEFSYLYFSAVEAGSSSFTFTMGVTDYEDFLHQVFLRYPVLYFYYAGYSWTSYDSTVDFTVLLKDVSVPWRQIYVVDSDATMKALIGHSLSCLIPTVHFVTVSGYTVDSDLIGTLADEIKTEHYLAFMGYNGNQYTYCNWDKGFVSSYVLNFRYRDDMDLDVLAKWRYETEQQALYLSTNLFALDMPDYMKELLIHDWLVNHNDYNTTDMDAPAGHMAYGALTQGTAVCQGYAEAVLLLCQAAGIPCMYVTGDGGRPGAWESHGWNCILIDNQWYMLDVTWDDPVTEGEDILQYDYFNITCDKLEEDHLWERSAYPECTATSMNIDTVRSLCENDHNSYSRYSSELLMTRTKAEIYYWNQLQYAIGQIPTPSQSPTLPSNVDPYVTENPSGIIAPTENSIATDPLPVPSGSGSEEESTPVIFVLAGLVALFAVGSGLVILKIRKERMVKKKRYYFDPTEPFDGIGRI